MLFSIPSHAWLISAHHPCYLIFLCLRTRGDPFVEPSLLTFEWCVQTINGLGKKARDGTISIDEMAGGTFTISNGGVYGSLLSTPIINPPQSAILGMHSINQRATVTR